MHRQTRRNVKIIALAFLAVFAIAAGGLFLVSLDTSTPSSSSSVSTSIFPKQDCCVPSADLKGVWGYTNSNGSSFTADITDKAIKIRMNANNGTSLLYWYGTFESYKPSGSVVTSELIYDDAVNILSKSASKDFVVGDTTLSFDFTIQGNTKKVNLSRV